MMISTLVESTPVDHALRPDAAGIQDPTRFSEFTLIPAPDLYQSNLIFQNPFCRLVQRTGQGQSVCNTGCGLADPASVSSHTCPFGLRMIRSSASMDATEETRWVGRRFPNVDAMHNALDDLLSLGLDEETILAHLPPNPIATDEELAASMRKGRFFEEEPVLADKAPMAGPAELPGNEEQILNVLEYVEQIQALLATARKPSAVCERFLRVLAGMVPFEEMSIYLEDAATGELVIAASVDQQSLRTQPLAQDCRLAPESVGVQALTQRRMLVEYDGHIAPVGERLKDGGTLAIPLPMRPGQGFGVWLASREKDQYPSRLGSDPVRVMRLLVSILTMRLQQMFPETGQPEETEAVWERYQTVGPVPHWDHEALRDILGPEIARAAVTGSGLALLRLQIASRGDFVTIPNLGIEDALRGVLRPFDQMAVDGSTGDAWAIVLPLADERMATRVATQLIEIIEDHLDACGGTEEQGLWPAVGISILGQDASDAVQMIEHSGVALRLAGQADMEEPVRTYADSLTPSDSLERVDHA